MRVAYFSPLPPKRTGIATYSEHLAPALARHAKIDFFDWGEAVAPVPGAAIRDYRTRRETLVSLQDYQAVLYHFGNNPHFHRDIYDAFLARPGLVVLHDTVLYFLMAGLGSGGMLREFLRNCGPSRLPEFFAIARDSPDGDVLRYPHPERYPLLAGIADLATGIVVHSETAARNVAALRPSCPIHVVPHLAYPELMVRTVPDDRAQLRRELGLEDDELLLGCFGFLGPTKRLPSILRALSQLRGTLRFRLLIVGEGPPVEHVQALGLADRVIETGFVEAARFDALLRATDLLVNLRHPSMGETSGPLTQAMAAGVPAIVSDHAWFAELPDGTVWKVPVDDGEIPALVEAIETLSASPEKRRVLGESGRLYVAEHCAPERVAARYADILRGERAHSGPLYPGIAQPVERTNC